MNPHRGTPDRWLASEPSLTDLMADPIMGLLLVGDGIDRRQVQQAVELARRRLGTPSAKEWSAALH